MPRKKNLISELDSVKRAVVYARYSSHNQREASIEQQIKWCMEYAERKGYTIIEIYSDKAISGKTDNRPQFQKMMRDSRKGLFDYVIAWKSNRMGRNMLQAMMNTTKLAEEGVKCLYTEESFDDTAAGRFALRNMMNVNQFYSENLAEDVRRGMMDNAEKCMVNGRLAFGFRKGKDGKYEVIEEEAAIVREIFQRILEDWQQVDIINDLNARGIKTHSGGTWKPQSFNTLLQNEQYIGVYKFSSVRIEGGIPAILDKKTFEEVRRKLANKKHPRGRKRDVEEYLLTGKLFCGLCKHPMVGISGTSRTGTKHYYYACQGKRQGLCDKKNVQKEVIESAVIQTVCNLIMDDETINWIVAGYQSFAESLRQESALASMEQELAEVNKSLGNVMKAIEEGIITSTTKERMVELEEQRHDLELSIRIEKDALEELTDDDIRYTIERYRNAHLKNREYHKELIRLFIKAVYVYDDKLKIVIKRGTTDSIEVPISVIDSLDGDETNCLYRIPSAVPIQYHTNPAGIRLYLHQNGIIIVTPF